MAVLYRHLKPDGTVFYIGIGEKDKRAYSKHGRNKHWKRTVSKYEYEVQILKRGLSWEEACELEILLISHYGRQDKGTGILVNMTDGGDGIRGSIFRRTEGEKVINIKTKEIFDSMISGARSIGMSQPAFQRRMRGEAKNNTSFVLLSNYKEGEDMKYNHYINYICTKTLKTFATQKECSDYLGIKPRTLSPCLNPDRRENNSTTIMLYKDYLEYGIIPPHVITKENIKVINKETKEIFESVRSAGISVNMDRGTLRRKVLGKSKNNTPFMLLKDYEELHGKLLEN